MTDLKNEGAELLAISVDPGTESLRLAGRYGFEFPLLSDPGLSTIDAYGVRHRDGGLDGDIARPAIFILDREGRIVWRQLTENWRVRARPEPILERLRAIP
jgi:peroxiredoxin